jgi:hypothetical protein
VALAVLQRLSIMSIFPKDVQVKKVTLKGALDLQLENWEPLYVQKEIKKKKKSPLEIEIIHYQNIVNRVSTTPTKSTGKKKTLNE